MSLAGLSEYCLPDSAADVVALLERFGDASLIVGGGTFVHGLEARGLLTGIDALIDLQKVRLNTVSFDGGALNMGATTTFAQLTTTPQINDEPALGAIKDALTYPPVQIRNVATVGGNIAASCPFFDLPTAFLALDGIVTAQGRAGERTIELPEFLASLFENSLTADEFVTALTIPTAAAGTASAFLKLETNANDLAIVNAAVRVTLDANGQCSDARVSLGGGVGMSAVRSPAAEAVLNGQTASAELFAAAGEAAPADIEAMSDHRASAEYRTAIVKVYVKRALTQAAARLNGKGDTA